MSSLLNKVLVGAGIIFIGKTALSVIGSTVADRVKILPGKAKINLSAFPSVFRVIWDIDIENTIGVNITVTELMGEVFFGDIKLTNISIYKPVTLFSGQKSTIQFVLEIPPITLMGDIIASIINYGVGTFFNKIRFKGLLKTSLLNVPIDMFIPLV